MEAKIIKLTDKMANITDIAFSTPIDWSDERQSEYFDWATQVVAGLRGSNAALEALFDKQIVDSRRAVGS